MQTESADEIAHRALREIDRYLSLRNMKTLDLFKMRSINTSACVGDGGDMLLSSDELIQLLKHTQVNGRSRGVGDDTRHRMILNSPILQFVVPGAPNAKRG